MYFDLFYIIFQIFVCFSIAIVTRMYIGYAVVALIVELNSIFLHLRQLLQICHFTKNDSIYRFNSLINLGRYNTYRHFLYEYFPYNGQNGTQSSKSSGKGEFVDI